MNKLFVIAGLILASATVQASDFFTLADQFFSKHVHEGKVAYSTIKSDQAELNALLESIAAFDLKGANSVTQKAFMINAYNVLAIKGIINKYPVKSPMKVSNFFDNKIFIVAGKKMSLNQLEKEKLYPMTKDPRLHFVLVCAAVSCPKLASFAYKPETLEHQLEEVTKKTLNDPDFIRMKGSKVELSEIFNWYSGDFKTKGKSTLDYINQYRTEKFPSSSKVSFYTYNWTLNDK
ncbi:DUF547 domain-containing protein [Fulvivirga sp. M361]|uniref:DUF547 domain-containing protein n=1 Tax=Fulvivirga sp. M361 TaxID=2594266 RepID=UPI00117B517F|nr:DUF547 domain-containing protein [Fulvivirga sp. M361]TRX52671.1 DUF547 domain-containing protein [Fulvivirga sp. M361]